MILQMHSKKNTEAVINILYLQKTAAERETVRLQRYLDHLSPVPDRL